MPIQFFENDSLKAIGNLSIAGNENEIIQLKIHSGSSGLKYARVELNDYPITYDNKLYMGYNVSDKVRVLGIIGKNADDKYIRALLCDDELIEYSHCVENAVKFSDFDSYHAIYLFQPEKISSGLITALRKFTDKGGTLAFIPGWEGDIETYNSFLTGMNSALIDVADSSGIRISDINTDHPLFEDVFPRSPKDADLPEINKFFRFNNSGSKKEYDIIKFPDGSRFLSLLKYNRGKFYVFASPFTEKAGGFVKHTLFVPTVYNIALQSVTSENLYYTLGVDPFVETTVNVNRGEDKLLYLKNLTDESEKIPTVSQLPGNRIRIDISDITTADNYFLSSAQTDIVSIALNYNRSESVNDYYTPDEINNKLSGTGISNFSIIENPKGSFSNIVEVLSHGIEFWRLFLLLSLLFILAEVFIIRFMK
jgi:hypothetical protein